MSVPVDLSSPTAVHVVAAGGAGMSSIATVLAQLGHRVTGSDVADGASVQKLRAAGIDVSIGHQASNIGDADLLVVSTAVPEDNPEVLAAHARSVPVLHRFELLSALAVGHRLLSVSGTHGKTTTSSMLAVGLVAAGADPSYILGAPVASLGASAAVGASDWFVLEADESDGSFLAGPRAAALVTNVEPDHLEYWGGWEQLVAGFTEFLAETDGPRIVCADDPNALQIGRDVGALTYGVDASADYRIDSLHLEPLGSRFTLRRGSLSTPVAVAAPGLHNALDAAGALAVVDAVGLDVVGAARGLADFTGAARRFERRGSARGVEFVDDYAHLPTEVRAALAAARSGGWGRVVATFQPHRYSRTEALWQEFATAFDDADVVVLTGIYAAGEAPRPGVSGELLVEAVRSARPDLDVRWCPDLDDVASLLADELREGDLCISVGAGDVTTVADLVMERFT